MISVKDRLPKHNQVVFVKVGCKWGVAQYSKHVGFEADWSAYDIYCDDDSGFSVTFDGEVTHWMETPNDLYGR